MLLSNRCQVMLNGGCQCPNAVEPESEEQICKLHKALPVVRTDQEPTLTHKEPIEMTDTKPWKEPIDNTKEEEPKTES